MTHLSPQITHLVSARPMSVTMGNAIRELKVKISNIDIDMVEQDVRTLFALFCLINSIFQAKDSLCQYIDNYIRDRIVLADEVIEDLAGKKIKDGDVILTYAKWVSFSELQIRTSSYICRSSVVEKVLLAAQEDGKKFSVIVIDSQPLLEGLQHFHAFYLSLNILAQARHSCVPSHVDRTLSRVHTHCSLLFHHF
jgi:translation initiation factor eIF-2B subunit delta